jgi:hypothetical protein
VRPTWRSIVGALLLALAAGCGPQGPLGILPGGPLWGSAEPGPPDWAEAGRSLTVSLETRRGWLVHSVTVICVEHDGFLYVPSRNAPDKRWVRNVLADPRVRVGVGGRVFEGVAGRVVDAAALEPVARKLLRKYYGLEVERARVLVGPPAPEEQRADVWMFRIGPAGRPS